MIALLEPSRRSAAVAWIPRDGFAIAVRSDARRRAGLGAAVQGDGSAADCARTAAVFLVGRCSFTASLTLT
jgi:hypothetical protein